MFPDCICCTLWQKLILRTELIERKNGAHWRAPLRVVFSFSSRFVHVATLSENSRAIHSPAHYAAREATATKKRTHCLLIRGSTEGKTLTGPPVRRLGHAREEDKRLEIKHRHDNLVGGRSVDRPGSEVMALRLFYCLRVCVVREKAWIRGYKYEIQWARSQTNERRQQEKQFKRHGRSHVTSSETPRPDVFHPVLYVTHRLVPVQRRLPFSSTLSSPPLLQPCFFPFILPPLCYCFHVEFSNR